MMDNDYKKFIVAVSEDAELQKALKDAEASYTGDKNNRNQIMEEIVIPIAAAKGYSFTVEDAMVCENAAGEELDDAELDAVNGATFCFIVGGDFEDCGCVIGGVAGDMGCTVFGTGCDTWR